MKRKIALLILMILALTLTLAACNQTDATSIKIRWDKDEETHVFNITLADFTEEGNSFNVYNGDGTVNVNGGYVKDIGFAGEFSNWDEVRPVAINGKYKLTLKPSSDGSYCDVTTVQQMCVAYNEANVADSSKLQSAKATAEQMEICGFTDTFDSNVVILYSITQTSVRFDNSISQKPLSSSVKVNGFYVGRNTQNLTVYEISTEYNYDAKAPIATITTKNSDGEEAVSEKKFARNSAGTFIDSNQILLYLRSLDKSSNSFQDSPSINVFNAYDKSLQTANFGRTAVNGSATLTRDVLLNGKDGVLATSLNVVAVTIGSNNFMIQQNLPDTLAKKNLDIIWQKEAISKFTTVRFRVGYLSYEIAYDNADNTTDWNEIWTALTPPTEEAV